MIFFFNFNSVYNNFNALFMCVINVWGLFIVAVVINFCF